MAQVVTAYVGVLLIRLALHACPHIVWNRLGSEALVDTTIGLNGIDCDGLSRLPLYKRRCVSWTTVITLTTKSVAYDF